MKIILPYKKPLFHLTPFTNLQLAAAQTHKDGNIWVFNHFIQLEFYALPNDHKISHFFNWNMLYSESCTTNLLHFRATSFNLLNNINYIQYIKNSLLNNWYVFIRIDTFYINEYENYNTTHMPHGLIIYGFDDDGFYISDFFKKNYLSTGKCSYKELTDAIKAGNLLIQNNTIDMFRVNPKLEQYEFNKKLFINFLHDYYKGCNTYKRILFSENYSNEYSYGIDIYGKIIDFINIINQGYDYSIFRGIELLFTHKEFMLKRLEFFRKNNYVININNIDDIVNRYTQIRNKLKIIRNFAIKLHTSRSDFAEIKKYSSELHQISLLDKIATEIFLESVN